jgi:hypothetical protein
MSFIDNFRKAEKSKTEKKGTSSIRRGMDRVREEWADVERKLRQRMRIYPQKSRAMAAGARGVSPLDMDEAATSDARRPDITRKPIFSIHGHDLNDE